MYVLSVTSGPKGDYGDLYEPKLRSLFDQFFSDRKYSIF